MTSDCFYNNPNNYLNSYFYNNLNNYSSIYQNMDSIIEPSLMYFPTTCVTFGSGVSIYNDGRVDLGNNTLDEAAISFWKAVSQVLPIFLASHINVAVKNERDRCVEIVNYAKAEDLPYCKVINLIKTGNSIEKMKG